MPGNPSGAESIITVDYLPLEAVVARFIDQNRHDLAELYQLASDVFPQNEH